jgi:HTH-type transcriptional regulator/antitoxin HipB
MTQAMVAGQLGVTQQSYAQLEANPAAVSVERLHKALRVLGVSLVLSPAGAQAHQDVAVPPPPTADTSRRSAKRDRPSANRIAKPVSAPERTPAATKRKTRSPAKASAASRTEKKRSAPKAVIKEREDW